MGFSVTNNCQLLLPLFLTTGHQPPLLEPQAHSKMEGLKIQIRIHPSRAHGTVSRHMSSLKLVFVLFSFSLLFFLLFLLSFLRCSCYCSCFGSCSLLEKTIALYVKNQTCLFLVKDIANLERERSYFVQGCSGKGVTTDTAGQQLKRKNP